MKRYWRIFVILLATALKRMLENRAHYLGTTASSVADILLMIFFTSVIFSISPTLAGWNKYEVFLLLGVYRVVRYVFAFLFRASVTRIPDYVRRGDLDTLLIKPFDSQFFLSLRLVSVKELVDSLTGVVLIVYSVNALGSTIPIWSWLLLGPSIGLGVLILYGIYFSLATLSIFFGQFNSLDVVLGLLRRPLEMPVNFYGRGAEIVLTFLLPLAFVVTVPVRIFLAKAPVYFFIWEVVVAAVVVGLSAWFWKFALRHYTSASS